MASSTDRVVRPNSVDEIGDPKILILWLDKFIGAADEYFLLKCRFFMTVDPTTGYEGPLRGKDIDASIAFQQALHVDLDGVQFILRAFKTVEDCFKAFENNVDKKIFLITSGSLGRMLVPALVGNFSEKVEEHKPFYIFCLNTSMVETEGEQPTNAWAWDYMRFLVMCDHQDDLLKRIVLDAAYYFYERGEDLGKTEKLKEAQQYCRWAKRLLLRCEKMSGPNINRELGTKIEAALEEINRSMATQDAEEEKFGENCM